jgi:hypothetical protein
MRRSLILATALLLSGCGAQEFFFNKDVSLTPGHGQMSDIKQRGVFVQSRPDSEGVPSPVVCAEPSPDAMSAVAASLAARADISDSGSGAFASSVNESVASVGLRTQTIQLLRDGFYRMCEGYMSGALTGEDYSIMQRRYQANMLALLAIEQLTGTVRAPAVALDTSSSARVIFLKTQHEEAQATHNNLVAQQEAANKREPKDQAEVDRLDRLVKENKATLDSLSEKLATANASVANVEFATRQTQQNTKEVSEAVVKIAESVIQKDYAGQMCFEYFRRREDGRALAVPRADGDLTKYCSSVFRQNLDAMKTSLEITNSCLRLADTLRTQNKLKEAQEQFKMCSGIQVATASPTYSSPTR